ncbi:hypothetical protein [Demequina globuliformis]|uniref:hypothetical protein n=1 Tax=Demequina globuliformis TaxID=676202 RepID=UPI0007857ECD|nr:hypothetical protein [Demequina globuliformis]
MSDMREDSFLDTQLDASSPLTSANSAERSAALAEMARDTEPSNVSVLRRRRPLVIGSVVGVALLGIGGAAVASGAVSLPFMSDPVTTVDYTLPSGAVCSGPLGDVEGSPEVAAALREVLTDPAFPDTWDIEAAAAELEAGGHTLTLEDGTEVEVKEGTPYWSADAAYQSAVEWAAVLAVSEQLALRGFPDAIWSYDGDIACPGADYPEWMEPGAQS